jgi:citronellol/citronellal dehydrogenase
MGGVSEIFREGLLAGQTAVVTGGGTNLGLRAAEELLACGANVVIAGRREDVLRDACDALGGERVSWVSGDIREPEDAARIVEAAVSRHGRLTLLVNNAGGQYLVPAESIAAKGWRAVMRLNVEGTMTMSLAAYDALRASGGGSVVNVTVSPHHGMPAMAHTGAARAAVEALTVELASRWRDDGVSVMAAAIGRFDTESLRKYPEVFWRAAASSVPLQRLGTMQEFGWLVATLVSPLGRCLSGTVVTLDGAADNWWGPWPPPAIVDESGTVPTESRTRRG